MLYQFMMINIYKITTYCDKIYTNFCSLNIPEDGVECESFPFISIDSLLVYDSKYYPQVYLDDCAQKIVEKQIIDYLEGNPFETDENYFLINKSCIYSITIELIQAKELMLLKVIAVKNAWFFTHGMHGFLIMGSNFRILYAIVVTI